MGVCECAHTRVHGPWACVPHTYVAREVMEDPVQPLAGKSAQVQGCLEFREPGLGHRSEL